MAIRTLNQHIFRLAGGLVLLSTCAILINVWIANIEHAKEQLAANLEVAESVFKDVLDGREELLFSSVNVITTDYGFRAAVATKDIDTINSVWDSFTKRISADLMSVITLDGMVLASSNDSLPENSLFPYPDLVEQAVKNGGATSLRLIGSKLYQTVVLPVKAPRTVAFTLVGFELDDELLERLKRITQLETSIQVENDLGLTFSASTLSEQRLTEALQQIDSDIPWLSVSLFGDTPYLSKRFLLNARADEEIWITLSENVNRLFNEFNDLLLKITFIACLSIGLSLLFGMLFSRKLSRPLHNLSSVAQKISGGDYEQTFEIRSNTQEIDELSDAFQSMQTNIKERQTQIAYQASHDLLTDLQNRYKISEVLDAKLESRVEFQVVGANILGFRGVNDIFGYANGDRCLQVIAERFKHLGGQSARLNGGEFLWIPESHITVEKLKELQHQIELPIVIDDVVMNVKIAIGMLHCPQDSSDTEEVLRRISITLDEARATEGAMVVYVEQFEQNYLRRLSIISELKQTLWGDSKDLSINYQPKLHMQSGEIRHAEALIRWTNPKLGFVPPDEFIAIAEQAGLIGDVTEWVIRRVIRDVRFMRSKGLSINVAINLSAKDVLNPRLLPSVLAQLELLELPTTCISFEITESDLVADPKRAVDELSRFREAGFSLAIDDFGTGYSSLAYLKSLPVSDLKIDKSFVLKLDTQKGDQNIVQTIIELAHSFDLGVVAEGVENIETLTMLKEWGCEWVQGYHICKPITVESLLEWHSSNIKTDWFH